MAMTGSAVVVGRNSDELGTIRGSFNGSGA